MTKYTDQDSAMQPVRASFKRVLLDCIANCPDPSDQKEMVMIAHENRIISVPEAFALIQGYGLEAQ